MGNDTRLAFRNERSQKKATRFFGDQEQRSMQVAVSTTRPFHSAMLANALVKHGAHVRIYSSAPRRYFRRLDDSVSIRLVPSLLQTAMHFMRVPASQKMLHADSWLYDRSVAAIIRPSLHPDDLFIGWATASLATARAARRRGARFVLDRACPHVDFQQQIVEQESAALGIPYHPEPAWFRDRQLAEYTEADRILAPSEYTRATFPEAMRSKIVKAPLFGRCAFPAKTHPERHPEFTVGVVGGEPVRKGFLYLLQAWERLAFPNARLLIRSDADFTQFPALHQRLARLSNVEFVRYVPDINDFYQRCDAFVLPSVDDGFGMALFEAMANEIPCIATTHCGSSELLTPGRDGIVIPPRNSDLLAEALLSLYQQEELRRTLASAARATAAALGRNDSSPLYDAAIQLLLKSLASADNALTPARSINS
jgi:glycosyltransferase involved in cell wall biosynthesis